MTGFPTCIHGHCGEGYCPAWLEDEADQGVPTKLDIQRTDVDEVRLGLHQPDEFDDATIYLTLAEASRLAHALGIAVLANEVSAHEAAKFETEEPKS